KQRVGLAAALLGEPEVLILDEPSSGLDPGQNAAFLALLRELAEMRTVMLSTHVLRDVEAVCGRVVIINRGRVLADGEPDRLAQQAGGSREVLLECRGIEPLVLETLSGVDRVTTETLPDGWLSLRVASRSSEDLRGTLMHAITNAGGEVRSLHRDAASLDGVFSQLLASEDGAA
ncbi:MAG: ABC transporter, partial [Planctomycetota bacterium]